MPHSVGESASRFPNLFIVGAARSGTTSLHNYLAQHPQIFMSAVKEPHFFADIEPAARMAHLIRPIKEEGAYLHLFRDGANHPVVGESSPSYLWDPRGRQGSSMPRPALM